MGAAGSGPIIERIDLSGVRRLISTDSELELPTGKSRVWAFYIQKLLKDSWTTNYVAILV
jgi:hypothetical protein